MSDHSIWYLSVVALSTERNKSCQLTFINTTLKAMSCGHVGGRNFVKYTPEKNLNFPSFTFKIRNTCMRTPCEKVSSLPVILYCEM